MKRLKALFAITMCLGILLTGTTANALVFNDNFNTNTVDTLWWSVLRNVDQVEAKNGRIEMTELGACGSGGSYGALEFKYPITGDFEATVEYELLNWPAGCGGRIYNGERVALAGSPGGSVQRLSNYDMGNKYATDFSGNGRVFISTSDQRGRLKYTRSGNTFSGYYWNGTADVLINSYTYPTNPGNQKVQLVIWPYLATPGVKVAFDNFYLNAPNTPDPQNDPPYFDPINNQAVNEDVGSQDVMITGVSPGPPDESAQTVVLSATSSNPAIVPDPSISGSGATRTLTYQPVPNASGVVTITVVANDGQPVNNNFVRTFTITVNPVDDGPVAEDKSATTNEDTPVTITLKATDIDSGSLTFTIASGPASGALGAISGLSCSTSGGITTCTATVQYTPNSNFNGSDSFTYTASDGSIVSIPAAVSITFNAVNDAPVALDDSYSVEEDGVLAVAATGVLSNDNDVEGNVLTVVLVSAPTHGGLTFNGNGSFTYTPNANFNGTDTFTYKANDGTTDSNVATVTISINAVNDAPVAISDAYSTNEDTVLYVSAPGVLSNDTDLEGSGLTAILVSGPSHGTLTLRSDGSFSYSPAGNYHGPDSFTYKANDGAADSNVASVSITVSAVNDAPVAVNDSYSTNEDTILNVLAPGVLGNDSDIDGDNLTVVLVTGPAHGSLILNANGSFSYTPSANYNGPDSFTYQARDTSGALSNIATVSITVNPVNDPPVLTPIGDKTTNEGELLEFTITAIDPDGDALTYSASNLPTGATFDSGTGKFSWTPSFEQAGNYGVLFTATDNGVPPLVASETITITVGNVNRPPVLDSVGNKAIDERQLLTITITANDPDGDTLTYSAINLPTGATFDQVTHIFTWMPTYEQAGTYVDVLFTVTDTALPPASDSETITITVGNVNRPPQLNPIGNKTVNENELLMFAVTGSDPDGDVLTYTANNLPIGATFNDATQTFSWKPGFDQAENYTNILFTATDNGTPTKSASESITITVGNINRPPQLNPIGNKTVNENELLTFAVTGSDPDGDVLTYTANNLPIGATFNDATQTFSWKPGFNQAGNYPEVEFSVLDNGSPMGVAVELVTITVGNVNRAPVFASVGTQQVPENQPLQFYVEATDYDGDFVTYSYGSLPRGAFFDTGTRLFSWTPDNSQQGSYVVDFYATDSGTPNLQSLLSVVINVGDIPTPCEMANRIINTVLNLNNLAKNVENSYLANLKKVCPFIEEGKKIPALNQLNAFTNKVQTDISKRNIGSADGANLIKMANELIAKLQG